jgi:hypothetical protein
MGINFHKYDLVAINVDEQEAQISLSPLVEG